MSHTPGPWKAMPRHSQNDGTQDEMSGLGWDIEGPPQAQLRGQFAKAADAKLAAAAPTLLDLARACLDRLRELSDVMDVDSYALEQRIEAVIEEATGGSDE